MAISAGRLTQMISVLNPVLTRNAAGEMTEELGVMRENSCGYPWQEQPERMQSGAEMAQAEIRIWGAVSPVGEITAASRLHVLRVPGVDRIRRVSGASCRMRPADVWKFSVVFWR